MLQTSVIILIVENILIKYLSLEAIENTIACMKYHFDKVLFFVYQDIYREEVKNINDFLISKCQVEILKPIFMDDKSLKDLSNELEVFVSNNKDNKIFIDLTGAEANFMTCVMGIKEKYQLPIFIVDIKNNQINSLDLNKSNLLQDLKENNVSLNIHEYIKMIGGAIDEKIGGHDYKFFFDKSLVKLIKKHQNKWNFFVNILNQSEISEDESIYKLKEKIIRKNNFFCYQDFVDIVKDACQLGIFTLIKNNQQINERYLLFRINNVNNIKLVRDAGAVYEQCVYRKFKENADDILLSISLDWDGNIKESGADLRNEIDVIYLNKYLLTFVSCKNREIIKEDIYELESIARNFAGNYVRMKIASPFLANEEVKMRADRLGVSLEDIEYE